jgi:predicted ester cyclase
MSQSSVETNKKIVARLYTECLNGRKWNLIEELLAPDFVNHLAGTRGRDAFLRTARALNDAFADMQFTIEDLFGEGDRVAIRWTLRGRHVGKFANYEPTGKPSEQQTNVIYRVEGGKLAESWIGPGPVRVAPERSPVPSSQEAPANRPGRL